MRAWIGFVVLTVSMILVELALLWEAAPLSATMVLRLRALIGPV